MKHLLIVDNDIGSRESLRAIFKGIYRVTTVESADKASSVLNAERVDLLLLDVVMPVKDGIEFLLEARHNDLDMELARPGKNELSVPAETQHVVLFTQALERLVDLFFIAPRLWLDGEADDGLRKHDLLEADGSRLVGESVTGMAILELSDRAEVPGLNLIDRNGFLPL